MSRQHQLGRILASKLTRWSSLSRYLLKYRVYAKRSICLFSHHNPLRLAIIDFINHPYFDALILMAICVNSIAMGLGDYGHIHDDPSSPLYMDLATDGSWRNTALSHANFVCTYIFLSECVLKILAMGFVGCPNTYLRDGWNCLDFIVVVSGMLESSFESVPNMSALRAFRALRPLRSVNRIPGVAKIAKSMVSAVPRLVNVIGILVFVLAIFSILGLQLYSGMLHTRCRFTPFPVTKDWTLGQDANDHKCLDGGYDSNFNMFADNPKWTKESSPWNVAQDCWWPVDYDNTRVCAFPKSSGYHCPVIYGDDDGTVTQTYCGSNFDATGNPRFKGMLLDDVMLTKTEMMNHPEYIEDRNWGYTSFDNFGDSFMSIFQSITLEGWTPIMYMCQDAIGKTLGGIFFSLLVVTGNFFALNLVLVVLNSAFESEAIEEKKEKEAALNLAAAAFAQDGAKTKSSCCCKLRCRCRRCEDFITGADGRKCSVDNIVTVLILANTVLLSMDRHPMSRDLERKLEFYNFCLTIAFTLEMLLKLTIFGPIRYLEDRFNVFDGVIVIVSLVELYFSPPYFMGSGGGGTGAVSALRSFRLFRIFKLAKKWRSMQVLLKKCLDTTYSMGPFLVLLVLFMYIYTLLGMSFFANRMHFDDNEYPVMPGRTGYEDTYVPRQNFDTFLWGFTTVFSILTGENWNMVLFDARRGTSPVASVYFVTLIVFGMFIVMNLFLAILLSNFTGLADTHEEDAGSKLDFETLQKAEESREREEQEVKAPKDDIESGKIEAGGSTTMGWLAEGTTNREDEGEGADGNEDVDEDEDVEGWNGPKKRGWIKIRRGGLEYEIYDAHVLFCFDPEHPLRDFCAHIIHKPEFDNLVLVIILISCLLLVYDNPLANPESAASRFLAGMNLILTILFAIESTMKIVATGLIFLPGSYLRDGWNCLDFGVVVISLTSLIIDTGSISALKALRAFRALRPLRVINRVQGLRIVVNTFLGALPDVFNVVLVCIVFFLIFSIVAVNYLKGRFFECRGHVFDNLISGTDYEIFLQDPTDWAAVKADSTKVNWFGPNSIFSGSDSWTSTCSSSFPSLPCCEAWPANGGGSREWSDTNIPTSKEICECWGAVWRHSIPQRFDNVYMAFVSFFEIASTEGWIDVMLVAVDSTDIDMQPKENNNLLWVAFFIFFMLFGCYLTVNLFVGVIIERFARLREEHTQQGTTAEILYTPQQAAWKKTQELMLKTLNKEYLRERMKPRSDAISKNLFPIVMAPAFERVIMFVVVLNALVMAVDGFAVGDRQAIVINDLNVLFVIIFNLEFLAKFGALRLNYFVHFLDPGTSEGSTSVDYWNCFDFAIVCGTDIGYLLMSMGGTAATLSSVAMVVRTFRVMRIVRLMNGVRSLKQLCHTLLITLPGLFNVFAVLMLLIFIYAIMGVQLFSTISYRGDVNEHANFRTFWGSVLLLLRFTTGENLNGYMHDLTRDPSGCNPDPEYDEDMCGYNDKENCKPLDGCGSHHAYWFILSFLIIITYVFLNLFIGVILEGFENTSDETGLPRADPDAIILMRRAFRLIVFEGELLPLDDLRPFMLNLPEPWGFEHRNPRRLEWMDAVSHMNLKVFEGNCIHFVDLVLGLTRRVVQVKLRKQGMHKQAEEFHAGTGDSHILNDLGSQKQYQHLEVKVFAAKNEAVTATKQVAASSIQRVWRKLKASRGPSTPRLAHFIMTSGLAAEMDAIGEVDHHDEIMRFLKEVREMQTRELTKDKKGANAVASSKKLSSLLSSVGFGNLKASTPNKQQQEKEKAGLVPFGSTFGSATIAPTDAEEGKEGRESES